jgi:hypothetical protein
MHGGIAIDVDAIGRGQRSFHFSDGVMSEFMP